jgi:hypothetical protein
VTLTHEYLRAGEVAQVEEHDVVYREQEPGAARAAAPAAPVAPGAAARRSSVRRAGAAVVAGRSWRSRRRSSMRTR